MEILKQAQYQTMPVEEEVVVIYAAVKGLIDDIAVDQVGRFEQEYLRYMRSVKADLLARIRAEKALSDELNAEIEKAINEFKQGFLA
jgi:F-type H+-transporting ATPase subunit alpha